MPQPPNLQNMLRQAQEMMAQQQQAQEALKSERVEASAGGGMVKVAMTGDLHLESITIDPDAVDPDDVEMLQDLVVAAVNEAIRSAQELQESKLGGLSGDFDPMSALDALGMGGLGGALGGGGGGLPGGGGAPPAGKSGSVPGREHPRRQAAADHRLATSSVGAMAPLLHPPCVLASRRRRPPGRRACPRPEPLVLAPPLQRLVTELAKLPGVGQRTAQRLAFHILRAPGEDAAALAEAIRDVKEKITLCEVCFNLAEGPRCTVCLDERRDAELICVVEEPGDVIPIERTHEYRGRYHVLGGALSPIDGVEPEDLKLPQLYARVGNGVREVILATNPTTTGEATALHVAAALHERAPDVVVTRLASGLPVGGDLEYADEVTLGRAFAGRRAV
jgi:recombination protein RecR